MKRITILLIAALAATASLAQTPANADSSPHLAFKGVPIDGTLSGYVAKMKQQGFTNIGTDDGIATLRGDFAGYRDCIVGAITLKSQDLVYKIGVIFPEHDTWGRLSTNYFSLKDMLTEKYGEPVENVEEFDTYSEPKDDGLKMMQVKLDACKYYSIYETEKGNIQLSIDHDGTSSCYVRLSYFDKINYDKIKETAIDDL